MDTLLYKMDTIRVALVVELLKVSDKLKEPFLGFHNIVDWDFIFFGQANSMDKSAVVEKVLLRENVAKECWAKTIRIQLLCIRS